MQLIADCFASLDRIESFLLIEELAEKESGNGNGSGSSAKEKDEVRIRNSD